MSGGKKNGQSSINAAFFRAMSRSAIVFILLLLLVTSLIFFDRILDIERESSRSHLSYVADQLTYRNCARKPKPSLLGFSRGMNGACAAKYVVVRMTQ